MRFVVEYLKLLIQINYNIIITYGKRDNKFQSYFTVFISYIYKKKIT